MQNVLIMFKLAVFRHPFEDSLYQAHRGKIDIVNNIKTGSYLPISQYIRMVYFLAAIALDCQDDGATIMMPSQKLNTPFLDSERIDSLSARATVKSIKESLITWQVFLFFARLHEGILINSSANI